MFRLTESISQLFKVPNQQKKIKKKRDCNKLSIQQAKMSKMAMLNGIFAQILNEREKKN